MSEEENNHDTVESGADTVDAGVSDGTVGGGDDKGDTVGGGNDTVGGGDDTVSGASFDWRKEIAGDNAKALKNLERFGSANDFYNSYQEAQNRIREGFKPPELPKDATEEQVKEYRTAIGVPEQITDYAINLPEGMVMGDEDKPLWDTFLQSANKYNLTQSELDKVAPAYYELEQQIRLEQDKHVKEVYRENDKVLRTEWASDYDANININENFLTKMGGDELKEAIMYGSTADGTPLSNHPTVAKFLNQVARQTGFSDGLAYDNEGNAQSVDDEIKEIMMKRTGSNRDSYYKDLKQVAKDDARLSELYDIRDKFKNKAS